MLTDSGAIRTLGQVAYEAYGDERGWTTVPGGPMPAWPDQDEAIQRAWQAAAEAVKAAVQ